MTDLGFQMFDTDNHYYEPTDAFTRHMDPAMAPRAMQWAEIDGQQRLIVGGRINHYFASPTNDPTWKPGVLREMMRGNNPKRLDFLEAATDLAPARPDFFDRDARLALATLTEAGRDLVSDASAVVDDVMGTLLSRVPGDAATMTDLVGELVRA